MDIDYKGGHRFLRIRDKSRKLAVGFVCRLTSAGRSPKKGAGISIISWVSRDFSTFSLNFSPFSQLSLNFAVSDPSCQKKTLHFSADMQWKFGPTVSIIRIINWWSNPNKSVLGLLANPKILNKTFKDNILCIWILFGCFTVQTVLLMNLDFFPIVKVNDAFQF